MGTTYQSHGYISSSTDAIYKKKKHAEKIAKMKAEGTYCDSEDPDLSFLNYNPSHCRKCPNYEECKERSEKRSQDILKYRRNQGKKPKTKRVKKKKLCGCK